MPVKVSFDAWVTCPKPNPAALLRLFCFPYAGGGASTFRTWADGLTPEVEVCPLQFPGRENRFLEPPFTQLALLVQELGRAILPYVDKPFAFFGHSMGALVSFELARHLRKREVSPVHLFVSGRAAPQLQNRNRFIHQLSDPEFLAALRTLNGTPETVLQNKELMRVVMPLLRADFALCETYVYRPEALLTCPLSIFGGLQDHQVSYRELVAWGNQTKRVFKLYMFPSDHFFLNSAPSLVWQVISHDLAEHLGQLKKGENKS